MFMNFAICCSSNMMLVIHLLLLRWWLCCWNAICFHLKDTWLFYVEAVFIAFPSQNRRRHSKINEWCLNIIFTMFWFDPIQSMGLASCEKANSFSFVKLLDDYPKNPDSFEKSAFGCLIVDSGTVRDLITSSMQYCSCLIYLKLNI